MECPENKVNLEKLTKEWALIRDRRSHHQKPHLCEQDKTFTSFTVLNGTINGKKKINHLKKK